jgi:hypothetical protein
VNEFVADLNIAHVRILTTFSDASTREYIISGENLPTVLGKISKFMKTSAGEITGNNFAEVFNDYANNSAFGDYSHAEGSNTIAFANYSHSEGNSTSANGIASHTEGTGTVAGSDNQHVQGKYNVSDNNDKFAFIIGNGTNANNRSNALAVGWDGKFYPNNSTTGIDLEQAAEREILSDTTENWNKQRSLIGKANTIYVYTDYMTIGNTVIPGFKIGDGNAYLIDSPFVTDSVKPTIIQSDTTANWNSQTTLRSVNNCIYVYTDFKTEDGVNIPGFKIGTGAYLIDIPFVTDWIEDGLVTNAEREFWNNKVTAILDQNNQELLYLTKDNV